MDCLHPVIADCCYIHYRFDPGLFANSFKDKKPRNYACSGPYSMAADPISAGGYTTFGLDYRGHGLSDGNRGDSPSKDRWIADLAESVKYIKGLGFNKVIVLGHSLGVAFAMCVADAVPNDISGLILLSSLAQVS